MKINLFIAFKIFLAFFFTSKCSQAQSYNWMWAKSAGEIKSDIAQSVATDASGNVFVAGYFTSPTITFGTTTLTCTGSANLFIVKYDAYGNVDWAKCPSGATGYKNTIAVDDSGNVFVTGNLNDSVVTFGNFNLPNSGTGGDFLVKYDPNGNVLWAKNCGGAEYDESSCIAVDSSGNVFIAGFFYGLNAVFDSDTVTNPYGLGASNSQFIAKYDRNGNIKWAKNSLSAYQDYTTSLATDASGNVYMTGYFYSLSISFGSVNLINADINNGSPDIFLAKFDSTGNVVWARREGGTDYDAPYSVTTDSNGNIYLAGGYGSSSITFGSTTFTNTGYNNIFLVKYSAGGNPIWARSAAGTNFDEAYGVRCDANCNVYLTGTFGGPTINFGSTTLSNSGLFLAKYNVLGTFIWAEQSGNNAGAGATSVATDPFGNIYIAGYFHAASLFLGNTILSNNSYTNGTDIFLAKHDSLAGMQNHQILNTISIYPNPSSGKFTIRNSNMNPEISLEIYDALGKKVYSSTISLENTDIDFSGQPDGIYFIQLISENEIKTEKISISH